jgi:ABC-type multidrug transport system fused ATPase/permease subunit
MAPQRRPCSPSAGGDPLRPRQFSATRRAPRLRALDNVCLDIAPGESVALVGPSGAGKTSIFQLLLRYYEVSGGAHPASMGRISCQLSLH